MVIFPVNPKKLFDYTRLPYNGFFANIYSYCSLIGLFSLSVAHLLIHTSVPTVSCSSTDRGHEMG